MTYYRRKLLVVFDDDVDIRWSLINSRTSSLEDGPFNSIICELHSTMIRKKCRKHVKKEIRRWNNICSTRLQTDYDRFPIRQCTTSLWHSTVRLNMAFDDTLTHGIRRRVSFGIRPNENFECKQAFSDIPKWTFDMEKSDIQRAKSGHSTSQK